MPKSCFDGYLTSECHECEYWEDGSDPEKRMIGCACPFPIMHCDAFARECDE